MLGFNGGLIGTARTPSGLSAPGVWTSREQALYRLSAQWPGQDPYFADVSLLLLGNGTNGSTTITDSSKYARGVTANGNAQISTAQSKFGGSSIAFDGTGDWLDITTTTELTLGSVDFTIEGWLYLNTVSGVRIIYDQRPAGGQGAYPTLYMDGAVLAWYTSSGARIASTSLITGVFYHFAVVRFSGSTRLYVNGTQTGITYTDVNNYLASRTYIGISAFDVTGGLNGYIDDFRITKGVARYTSNFTPPTTEMPPAL